MGLLNLVLRTSKGEEKRQVNLAQLVIAGWTSRDPVEVEAHIKELEKIGVAPPASTPIFYRVAASRATTSDVIEASGSASSGEVEFVVLALDDELWVGVGSDHTDREVEAFGVTVSKQMCDKPIAPTFWPYSEVAAHWDRLILRSYISERGASVAYQEGPVNAMLPPEDLIARFTGGSPLPNGTMMFCGTLAASGGVRSADRFRFELADPELGRTISHEYTVASLPVVG